MTDKISWDEEVYEQVFDEICAYVDKRKQEDNTFTIEGLKRMVDEAYQRRGMDWIGKGPVQFTIESATVAALEQKLVEWNKQKERKNKP
jgi:hypothetical protein